MSDDIIVAIIGLIGTIISAAIVPILEKRLDADSSKQSKITVTGNQLSARKRRGKHFRVSIFWFIPVVVAFLTLIVFLGVQHEARQNVKKILADSPEFHMNMGDQYAAMGDFANAELEYYEAIENDNSNALVHDKRAVALAKEGRLEEALKENMTAVSLAEDIAQYHNNKGVTLLEMGVRTAKEGNEKARLQYWKNALEACKTAVELDSKVAEYHYNLSMAFHYAYDLDNAISECTTALQLNPDSSEYHSFYAILLYDNGQHQNALAEARKAVELAPDNADAYYKLAGILHWSNQLDEAVSAYRQAIQRNPHEGAYHNYLGKALYDLGYYREALKECEAAIKNLTLYPYQQSINCYDAAAILIALNRYDEALQYVKKSIDLYTDDPRPHYLHYALLTYFNRNEEAAQELETAYELGGIPFPEDYA